MSENAENKERREQVNHPRHYNTGSIECITIVRNMGFDLGNAVKYLWRAESKQNIIEDLEKAIWYLNDIIEHDYLRGMFHYVPVDNFVVKEIVQDIQNEAIKGALSTILYSLHYLTKEILISSISLIRHAIILEQEGVKSNAERKQKTEEV